MPLPALDNETKKNKTAKSETTQNRTAGNETTEHASRFEETGELPKHLPLLHQLRRILIGHPLATDQGENTLLSKIIALPVFSSDAISSVAYATQEIVLVMGAAGLWALAQRNAYTHYTLLVSALIVALLVIVVTSYWQTIFAYPSGGGSYIVSKENLGTNWSLIAAGALLIDYVLTVSVSIASGVQNLSSIPFLARLHPEKHLVLVCCFFVALLMIANLRGLKESGTLFAIPTYIFVGMCYLMIGLGLFGGIVGWHAHMAEINNVYNHVPEVWKNRQRQMGAVGLLVLMRAFANGCSAMTGTEAVSNGIPAFREPKCKNAALTLLAMGVILGTLFLGISFLAARLHVVYYEGAPAVIDQISGAVFGKTGAGSILYLVTQIFTAAILVLAANTSFADFPRLSSILARDGFMPKQLHKLGDRLVFSNGIILLGLFAAALIVLKRGNVDALIPLYATGVFTAFTLSQSGMVHHWLKLKGDPEKGKGWHWRMAVNGLGAVVTFVVLCTILIEKFVEGAWISVLLTALLFFMFKKIHRHYTEVAEEEQRIAPDPDPPTRNTALVLIGNLNQGAIRALEYGKLLGQNCRAIHVETEPGDSKKLQEQWPTLGQGVPLVILSSPYRQIVRPIKNYIAEVHKEDTHDYVTLIIPEAVPEKWWQQLLHGQVGLRLKVAFLGHPDVIVSNVRYRLLRPAQAFEPPADDPGPPEHSSDPSLAH
jgi:amino acid transporter